ncbi:acyl carrier protein [Ancylomarina sp.]|uniref:acyl carrier protein n=1 Tax=Ancylomarina sp. TaxID=1970196 RepID=UPI0035668A4D
MNNHKVMKDKLRQYIIEATFSSENDIKDDTLLFEEGLFDSMGLLFLIDFIRDEFHIDTKDNELLVENFASIDSISEFILDRLEVKESSKLVNTPK